MKFRGMDVVFHVSGELVENGVLVCQPTNLVVTASECVEGDALAELCALLNASKENLSNEKKE